MNDDMKNAISLWREFFTHVREEAQHDEGASPIDHETIRKNKGKLEIPKAYVCLDCVNAIVENFAKTLSSDKVHFDILPIAFPGLDETKVRVQFDPEDEKIHIGYTDNPDKDIASLDFSMHELPISGIKYKYISGVLLIIFERTRIEKPMVTATQYIA